MTVQPPLRSTRVLCAFGDGPVWATSLGLATWARYAFEATRVYVSGLLLGMVFAVRDILSTSAPGLLMLGLS